MAVAVVATASELPMAELPRGKGQLQPEEPGTKNGRTTTIHGRDTISAHLSQWERHCFQQSAKVLVLFFSFLKTQNKWMSSWQENRASWRHSGRSQCDSSLFWSEFLRKVQSRAFILKVLLAGCHMHFPITCCCQWYGTQRRSSLEDLSDQVGRMLLHKLKTL